MLASEGYPCTQADLEVRGQWEGHTVDQAKVRFLSGKSGLHSSCSFNMDSQAALVLCGKMLCIDNLFFLLQTNALSPGNKRMERIESLRQAQQCRLNSVISVLTALCGEVADIEKSR